MRENGKAKFHPRNKCLSTIICYTIYKFTAALKFLVKISCQNADIDFSRETLIQVTLCATKSC